MELKLFLPCFNAVPTQRFNRTFMELKLGNLAGYLNSALVLIGPSWN